MGILGKVVFSDKKVFSKPLEPLHIPDADFKFVVFSGVGLDDFAVASSIALENTQRGLAARLFVLKDTRGDGTELEAVWGDEIAHNLLEFARKIIQICGPVSGSKV